MQVSNTAPARTAMLLAVHETNALRCTCEAGALLFPSLHYYIMAARTAGIDRSEEITPLLTYYIGTINIRTSCALRVLDLPVSLRLQCVSLPGYRHTVPTHARRPPVRRLRSSTVVHRRRIGTPSRRHRTAPSRLVAHPRRRRLPAAETGRRRHRGRDAAERVRRPSL